MCPPSFARLMEPYMVADEIPSIQRDLEASRTNNDYRKNELIAISEELNLRLASLRTLLNSSSISVTERTKLECKTNELVSLLMRTTIELEEL